MAAPGLRILLRVNGKQIAAISLELLADNVLHSGAFRRTLRTGDVVELEVTNGTERKVWLTHVTDTLALPFDK